MFQHLLDFFSINKLLQSSNEPRKLLKMCWFDGGRGQTKNPWIKRRNCVSLQALKTKSQDVINFFASFNVTNVLSMLFSRVEQRQTALTWSCSIFLSSPQIYCEDSPMKLHGTAGELGFSSCQEKEDHVTYRQEAVCKYCRTYEGGEIDKTNLD